MNRGPPQAQQSQQAQRTATLDSPFLSVQFVPKSRADFLIKFVLWMVFWLVVLLALGYIYIWELPPRIGFDKTVLLGIALLVLSQR